MTDETDLPDPPVPADLVMTGFPRMPLDLTMFLSSRMAMLAPREALGVAVLLWATSWHQTPAGSLPNDDAMLAAFARVDLETWQRIREWALHKFALCKDGRWYHPTVCTMALEAAATMRSNRSRTWAATRARMKTGLDPQHSDSTATDQPQNSDSGITSTSRQRDNDVTVTSRDRHETVSAVEGREGREGTEGVEGMQGDGAQAHLRPQRWNGQRPQPAGKTRIRKPTPCPADFRLMDEHYAWANEALGFDVQRVDLETEEFLNWARDKGIRRADWARAWRDSLIRHKRWEMGSGGSR